MDGLIRSNSSGRPREHFESETYQHQSLPPRLPPATLGNYRVYHPFDLPPTPIAHGAYEIYDPAGLDMMDRDSRSRRYDDGEVTRYGAGESYRPFNDRGPRRARSPLPRERPRSPLPLDSDRYIPDRTPQRRSRSPDRFRRDRSRDRDLDSRGGDSWRRRDDSRRSRSPRRSPLRRAPSRRRSPLRRSSPPPRRFSPPRRDDRDDRDRMRSPRRGYDSRLQDPYPAFDAFRTVKADNPNAVPVSGHRLSMLANRGGDTRGVPNGTRSRAGESAFAPVSSPSLRDKRYASRPASRSSVNLHEPNGKPNFMPSNVFYRGRSRSPYDRDRPPRDTRDVRDRDRRSLSRRASPVGPRGDTYRRRSPSIDRRDNRYVPGDRRPSPPRESAATSAIPSKDTSRRSSPQPSSVRKDDRSMPQSPVPPSRPLSRSSRSMSVRDRSPWRPPADTSSTPLKSPPRGPAALRAPPTGPRDARDVRDTRGFPDRSSMAIGPPARPAAGPAVTPGRNDIANSPVPSAPSGPRGYVASRGSYSRGGRGGRGGWPSSTHTRDAPPSSPAVAGSNNIPTGPRGTPTSSIPSTPVSQSKPFNPPKGPAADLATVSGKRPSFAEQVMASFPPIVPGGRLDPAQVPIQTGVIPELQPHFSQLQEEEEKLRQELDVKQEKLRKSLLVWDRLERESAVAQVRTEACAQALAKVTGGGVGGAAF